MIVPHAIKVVLTKLEFLMHDVAKSYECLLSATVSQIACVLMLIMISVCSCERKRDPVLIGPSVLELQKTNKVRKQLGLREIKDTWNFYYRDLNVDKWKDTEYQCKDVAYWDTSYTEIKWEGDYYYTGKKFVAMPGFSEEEVD